MSLLLGGQVLLFRLGEVSGSPAGYMCVTWQAFKSHGCLRELKCEFEKQHSHNPQASFYNHLLAPQVFMPKTHSPDLIISKHGEDQTGGHPTKELTYIFKNDKVTKDKAK